MEYPKKLKQQVRDLFKKHAWNMGVSHYFLDILWSDEEEEEGAAATMRVERRYLRATMTIFPNVVKSWKKDGEKYLDHVIAHETAHILTIHMMELVKAPYKTDEE